MTTSDFNASNFSPQESDIELIANIYEKGNYSNERIKQLSNKLAIQAIEKFVRKKLETSAIEQAFYEKFQNGFSRFQADLKEVEAIRCDNDKIVEFVKKDFNINFKYLNNLISLEFNGDLNKFKEDVEGARAQVAANCAYDQEFLTVQLLIDFGLKEQKSLLRVGKICALRDVFMFIEHFKLFGFDQPNSIEMAKFCAQVDSQAVASHFIRLGVIDQNARAEIAKLCFQNNPVQTAKQFKKFRIKDANIRLELLKYSAQREGAFTILFMSNFDIQDPQMLAEVKELCIQQMGGITDILEIVKRCAQKDGELTAEFIKLSGITDPATLLEIAKLCAVQSGRTAFYIKQFNIKNEKDRFEVLKLCSESKDFSALTIKLFDLKDSQKVMEILELCVQKNPKTMAGLIGELNFDLKNKLRLLLSCLKKDRESVVFFPQEKTQLKLNDFPFQDELKVSSGIHAINAWLNHYKIACPESLSPSLKPLVQEKDESLEAFKIRQERQINLLRLVGAALVLMEQTLSEAQMKELLHTPLFAAILQLPRPDLRWRLIVQAIEAAETDHFPKIPAKKAAWHEILGLLLDRSRSQGCGEAVIDEIIKASQHHYFRDGKHNQPLIEAMLLLVENETIDGPSKERLLKKLTALLKEDKKEDQPASKIKLTREEIHQKNEKEQQAAKERMLLFGQGVNHFLIFLLINNPAICETQDNRTLGELMQASFEQTFPVPMENFSESYAKTFGASRAPAAIITYFSKLKSLNDKKVLQDIAIFMQSVIQGTHLRDRHAIDKNPHLQQIAKKYPDVLQKWYQEEPSFVLTREKEVIVMDTENPIDLLLSGSEVIGSCQKIDGDPNLNKGLLGYLLDGKNRLIVVKDDSEGKILGRALLKLLWDGEKPVLFLERIYLNQKTSSFYSQAIIEMALRKAKSLGLDLVTLNTGSIEYEKPLQALGGPASFEYSDATDGVFSEGRFPVPFSYQLTESPLAQNSSQDT